MPINFRGNGGKMIIRSMGGNVTASSQIFDGIVAPPALSSLTWFNQDAATASNGVGVLNVSSSGQSPNNRHFLGVAAPATPWTLDVGFTWNPTSPAYPVMGMAVIEQSTGKFIEWDLYWNGSTFHSQWSRLATYNAGSGNPYQDSGVPNSMSSFTIFLRYVDDGTNLSVYWSNDNVTWNQFNSNVSRTDYLAGGPSHVGLCFDAVATPSASVAARVFHWKMH
jgi:hypothetical protein